MISLIKRRKWTFLSILIVLIIVLTFILLPGKGAVTYEVATSKIMNLTEEVSVTGRVIPQSKADLSFERSGNIERISVKVGDSVKGGQIIATLESSDLKAQLKGAEANVLAESAKLSDLVKGTKSEELAVYQQKLMSSESDFSNSMRDALTKVEDAITNKTDILFNNAQTVNPRINIRTENKTIEDDINSQRLTLTEKMSAWRAALSVNAIVNTDSPRIITKDSLSMAKKYFDSLANIVNVLSVNNSGLSQTYIDSYRASVSTAQAEFNLALTSENNSESAWKIADNELTLQKSGNTSESIQVQMARVEQAKASVLQIESTLAKSVINSPINGIVTKSVPDVGEVVNAGVNVFSVMSDDVFKLEVQVPEADIAKVKIGDKAKTTLDAYGSDVFFPSTVTSIDPAETMIEGVATYKVTLYFDQKDARVRSGMTANIDIMTDKRDGVVSVPFRAIYEVNGKKVVKVQNGKIYTEKEVTVGLKGSDGNTEIIKGLSEGELVVTFSSK